LRIPALAVALCLGVAPALAQQTVLEALNEMQAESAPSVADVEAIFNQVYATACPKFEGAPTEDPQSFDIRFRYESDDVAQPDRLLVLYQFFCFAGAYNAAYAFFTWDGIEGLKPLSLPQPQIDVEYEDDLEQRLVKSIAITGYAARPLTVNAQYDAGTKTIHSESYWRGLGDASHGGNWQFDDGEFVLRDFYVDASYDEQFNPKTLVDFGKPNPVK
jgi:hypothetical protein